MAHPGPKLETGIQRTALGAPLWLWPPSATLPLFFVLFCFLFALKGEQKLASLIAFHGLCSLFKVHSHIMLHKALKTMNEMYNKTILV